MKIEKNKVVTFHYVLKDASGVELESSKGEAPTVYLHGHPGFLPGLTAAMEGRSAGESYEVTLSPKEGYGERFENAKERIPLKNVKLPGQQPIKRRLEPGTIVEFNSKDGLLPGIVIKMGLKSVDIDTNHPLAGQTLTFDIDIVDVRDASEEEIAHGHVHGPGGHQH